MVGETAQIALTRGGANRGTDTIFLARVGGGANRVNCCQDIRFAHCSGYKICGLQPYLTSDPPDPLPPPSINASIVQHPASAVRQSATPATNAFNRRDHSVVAPPIYPRLLRSINHTANTTVQVLALPLANRGPCLAHPGPHARGPQQGNTKPFCLAVRQSCTRQFLAWRS